MKYPRNIMEYPWIVKWLVKWIVKCSQRPTSDFQGRLWPFRSGWRKLCDHLQRSQRQRLCPMLRLFRLCLEKPLHRIAMTSIKEHHEYQRKMHMNQNNPEHVTRSCRRSQEMRKTRISPCWGLGNWRERHGDADHSDLGLAAAYVLPPGCESWA